MLGSESSGLRASLKDRAEYTVGLLGARDKNELGVDSLNVSVAAALLSAEFLRVSPPPQGPSDDPEQSVEGDDGNLGF